MSFIIVCPDWKIKSREELNFLKLEQFSEKKGEKHRVFELF